MAGEQNDGDGAFSATPNQRRLLEDVFELLAEHDRWPTYTELDYEADRHGVDSPLSVMRSLSPTYLHGVGEVGPLSANAEVGLSLLGLAATAAWNDIARQDLNLFMRSVRQAVAISDAVRPPKVARFDPLEFMQRPASAGAVAPALIRLGWVWSSAGGNLWSGLRGVGTPEWSAELHQQNLRAYRHVREVSDLLQIERNRVATLANPRPGLYASRQHSPEPPLPTQRPQWVELLPDGFREAVANRVVDHGADAINAGWIELAELIHRKVGIDLDGEDLINHAFGGKTPRIPLGADTKTGNNLQQGYTDLMRGLARMRNAHSHRGRPDVTDLHVAATILAMGECFVAITRVGDA